MFNLIKMNFYRLFRQKSFYITAAAAALIGWFMVFMIWLTPVMEEKLAAGGGEMAEGDGGFHVGIRVGGEEESDMPASAAGPEEFNVTEFADEFFSGGFSMILISVGAAIIANSERKRGFVKNLGGQVKPRGMLTLSKLPAMLLELGAIYAALVLSVALFGRLYFKQYTLGNISVLCRTISVQLLLGLAFGALILLISTLGRSAAAGIIAGILLASGLVNAVCFFLNRLATAYLGAPEDFDISRGSLSYYIEGITSEAGGGDIAAALIVGTVYLILTSAAGWFLMEKRDIV